MPQNPCRIVGPIYIYLSPFVSEVTAAAARFLPPRLSFSPLTKWRDKIQLLGVLGHFQIEKLGRTRRTDAGEASIGRAQDQLGPDPLDITGLVELDLGDGKLGDCEHPESRVVDSRFEGDHDVIHVALGVLQGAQAVVTGGLGRRLVTAVEEAVVINVNFEPYSVGLVLVSQADVAPSVLSDPSVDHLVVHGLDALLVGGEGHLVDNDHRRFSSRREKVVRQSRGS
mmetsp:Transcript_14370/g.26443  ORF Transcript_14370/g.26443 Transcript_14370/m.26443 type:complete len:226 (-) Transcript_14370:868-1545(-)